MGGERVPREAESIRTTGCNNFGTGQQGCFGVHCARIGTERIGRVGRGIALDNDGTDTATYPAFLLSTSGSKASGNVVYKCVCVCMCV